MQKCENHTEMHNLHSLQPVSQFMYCVCPLLKSALEEGDHVRLVLPKLQILLFQLLVSFLEPAQFLIFVLLHLNFLFQNLRNLSFLLSSFSSRDLI